jgi:hypothetical protein
VARFIGPVRALPPTPLLAGFGAFLALLAYVLVASLSRREVPTFLPREVLPLRAVADGPDTLTVDARDSREWRLVDLDRGRVLPPPDTAGWDLGIRRFHIIVSRGITDLGTTDFDRLARAPQSGYIANTAGPDPVNPAVRRWYSYSMLSHLLVPKGRVYVMQTSEGRHAKLQVLSYYCPGLQAGCLTFRYRFLD